MEIKQEHASLRKQLSIMKEELVITAAKKLVNDGLVSIEDMNNILASLMRIEFRIDVPKLPAKGMMNFDSIDVK